MDPRDGLEPPFAESESDVLPLDERRMKLVARTGFEPALHRLKIWVPRPIRRPGHGASEGNRTLISRLAI